MSTPVPPSVGTILTTSGATGTPTISIPNPPTSLTTLPPGSSILATVSALQAGNQVKLDTALGALIGKASAGLKPGQSLTLNVLPQPPSAKGAVLQIIAVAGKPASGPTIPLGSTVSGPATTALPGTATSTAPTLASGQTVIATIISPVTTSGAAVQPTASPPSAFTGATPAPTTVPGQATASPANLTTAPATPVLSGQGAPVQQGSLPISGQPAPQAGALLKLTVVSVTPTPSATPTIPAGSPAPAVGQTFTGIVTGTSTNGQPVVQSPIGSLAIETSMPVPKGAEIVFKLETSPFQSTPSTSTALGSGFESLFRGQHWPTLDELTSALVERPNALTDRISSMLTPRPDAKLGASLIFLLSALKGGDLKTWIGETALRELDRMRPDLIRRLGEDVRLISTNADEADTRAARPTGEWRMIPLPLFGEGMEQSRLLVRRDGGDDDPDSSEKRKETRFVVDLTMTSIGRLQLDGLIDTGARRFDMLVRTTSTLPPRFRQDILGIFASANETIGLNGGLTFRATPDALIETAEPKAPQSDGGLVV